MTSKRRIQLITYYSLKKSFFSTLHTFTKKSKKIVLQKTLYSTEYHLFSVNFLLFSSSLM